jgi:hypothetical protein
MATFLTTSKMDPALAERIEASVRGQKGSRTARRTLAARARRIVSLARLVFVLTAVFGVYTVVAGRREARRALERSRAALLETVRERGASLPAADREAAAFVARIEPWLGRLAREYEGDLVAEELRSPSAFATMLARPLVYVRGTTEALGSPSQLGALAAASTKDALVLCLLEPPETRSEKVFLDKVRSAYSGGWNLESRTSNVRRLNDATVGLPFLSRAWSEKVRSTEDAAELVRLRTELERAPIEQAKQAARAGLLLVAIDEPGDGKGPTELDGERIHPVRVALVDLEGGKVVLRARHGVDPSWVSASRRARYASGFDGCALALDVHEDVRRAAAPAAAIGRQ